MFFLLDNKKYRLTKQKVVYLLRFLWRICAADIEKHEALCSSWIRKCEKLLKVIQDLCNGSR